MNVRLPKLVMSLAAVLFLASETQADFDLQVTEIWFGQDGTDLTEDWFEITNLGDTPWAAATDGGLWFDDDSANASQADPILDIASIAPGESAVVVLGQAPAVTEFRTVWDPVKAGFQVGYSNGSGLGQGGNAVEDVVNIWLGDPLGSGTIIDTESYGMTVGFSGQSWDVDLQAYSTVGNAAGAVATIALGGTDGDEPAIGSPGSNIPEPASMALSLGGALAVALRVRRHCS